MASTINRAQPVTSSDLVSSIVRGNFGHAADDIEALQSGKQDTLVSGTSIKTINGNDILGSGNVVVAAEGLYHTSPPATPQVDDLLVLNGRIFIFRVPPGTWVQIA